MNPSRCPSRAATNAFPLHRIYCVGRNYNDHVKEMGGVVGRDPPFFFAKPNDAIVLDGKFPYPAMSQDVHYELELVVALGPEAAVFGYATGIDFTRRDLQAEAKKLGPRLGNRKSLRLFGTRSAHITRNTNVLEQAVMSLDVNWYAAPDRQCFGHDLVGA